MTACPGEMLRGVDTERSECAQHDSAVTPAVSPTVTLNRSEGSVELGMEMLRCTQHDNVR
jgi:hypothetical protein